MYETPTLRKYGGFRQLTQSGPSGDQDLLAQQGIGSDGCVDSSGPPSQCPDGGVTVS